MWTLHTGAGVGARAASLGSWARLFPAAFHSNSQRFCILLHSILRSYRICTISWIQLYGLSRKKREIRSWRMLEKGSLQDVMISLRCKRTPTPPDKSAVKLGSLVKREKWYRQAHTQRQHPGNVKVKLWLKLLKVSSNANNCLQPSRS